MSGKKIRNIISNIITVIIVIIAIIIYRKYDFNFYTKAIQTNGATSFLRDNEIKYSKSRSYKIENTEYTDAMFYREIEVKKNTPYRVTCMIKTENVIGKENDVVSGAQICLSGTEEHSKVLSGDNDWTKVEFLFNSKKDEKVEIGFRLGGNLTQASGTAWFSDLTIEKGSSEESNTWNFGCFIIENVDVQTDELVIRNSMSTEENSMVETNMRRLQSSIKSMSENKINIEYKIIKITDKLTTLSYDETNGYYISDKDVYNLINKYVEENSFDHIYVCTNLALESKLLNTKDVCEWIGLGNMTYFGKGLSNIRITQEDYTYSSYNTYPEEVFLHEFLHTLERNSGEYGYTVPELHSYEENGYKEDQREGLKKWYTDYMNCKIKINGTYIGLPTEVFTLKPPQEKDFGYSYELDLLDEPNNIPESIQSVLQKVKNVFKKRQETSENEERVS